MILEWILNLISFFVTDILFAALPVTEELFKLPAWSISAVALVQRALMFFPSDVFAVILNYFLLKYTVFIGWALVEWIYKKIPGID